MFASCYLLPLGRAAFPVDGGRPVLGPDAVGLFLGGVTRLLVVLLAALTPLAAACSFEDDNSRLAWENNPPPPPAK